MKSIRPLFWLLPLLTLVLVFLGTPVTAQRIPIEEETQPAQTDTETARPSPSRRIIPPEDFGKFREQDDPGRLSRRATIEKLRADSAAMRVRFEERLRSVLADSRQMRSTIRTLQNKIEDLQQRLRAASDTSPSGSQTRDRRTAGAPDSTSTSDRESAGSSGIQTSRRSSTESSSRSSWTQGTKLNPNQASLNDLKAVPGMTDRIAERIQWYRENVQTYRDVQDLRRVPGIDRQLFNEISPYFYEGPYQ